MLLGIVKSRHLRLCNKIMISSLFLMLTVINLYTCCIKQIFLFIQAKQSIQQHETINLAGWCNVVLPHWMSKWATMVPLYIIYYIISLQKIYRSTRSSMMPGLHHSVLNSKHTRGHKTFNKPVYVSPLCNSRDETTHDFIIADSSQNRYVSHLI